MQRRKPFLRFEIRVDYAALSDNLGEEEEFLRLTYQIPLSFSITETIINQNIIN